MTMVEAGYSTARVSDLTGLSLRQLGYWDQIGVLKPSLQPARGPGTRRAYSRDDIRLAAILQAVLPDQWGHGQSHNVHLAQVRQLVVDAFRAQPRASFFVLLDGNAVVTCDTVEDAVAATNEATVSTIIWPDRLFGRA